jgi:hypothetical protein
MYKKHEIKPNIATANVVLRISTSLITVLKAEVTYITKSRIVKLWYSIVSLVKDSKKASEHHYSFIVSKNLIML